MTITDVDHYQAVLDAAGLRGEEPMEAMRRYLDLQNRLLYFAYLKSEAKDASDPIEEN